MGSRNGLSQLDDHCAIARSAYWARSVSLLESEVVVGERVGDSIDVGVIVAGGSED